MPESPSSSDRAIIAGGPRRWLLLSPPESDGDLGLAAQEVEFEGHEAQPLALHGADESIDFAAMEQEFARAHRIVVVPVALGVRRDVHPFEEHLASGDAGVGLLDGGLATAQRLDLGPGQHDARLPRLEDVEVVGRLGIAGDRMPALRGRIRFGGHEQVVSSR
jgi:hypothetical protein